MEYWDAYDRFRKPLGYMIRRGEPIPDEARHLVVHMVFFNSKGEVLIQRRADDKELAPGLWAFTGGAAVAGETSEVACVRETEEEMGFTPDMREAELTISYVKRDAIVDVYVIKTDVAIEDLKLQTAEVAEAKWMSREEFIPLARDKKHFWQYRYLDMLLRMLDEAEYIWNRA